MLRQRSVSTAPPGKRKAGSLDSEGRILGRGVYRKTDLMQDWKDIEQERGIATAALSSDMPAVKHRNRLVACIAVIFVAAALLFAMPSLAYASSEASASPQGSEAQEILLQQQRSSKSVDITPNQPDIAPPPYTATDAYTTTSDKNSEVVAVSGDDASNRVGYTEDGKDSDDDSDDASSTEQNASDGANQNTGASDTGSDANSGDTSNPDTADKGTGDSTGAPAIDDELATGDKNQSAQPTVDSDSKGKDVISTDGSQADQGEDLSSATSSSNRGEVSTSSNSSSSITPAATGDSITIHFGEGFSSPASGNQTSAYAPDVTFGNADDPIWQGGDGTFITLAGTPFVLSDWASNYSKYTSISRVGYNFTGWVLTYQQSGKYVMRKGTTSLNGFKTYLNNAGASNFHAYAMWTDQAQCSVNVKDMHDAAYPAPYTGAAKYMTTIRIPSGSALHDSDLNTQFIAYSGSTKGTSPITDGMTLSDVLETIFHFRGKNANRPANFSSMMATIDIIQEEVAEDVSFTVTYNNGGGTGTAVTITYTTSSPNATTDGTATGATPGGFTRTGYTFKGWATANGASAAQIADKGALKPTLACANGGAYTLYAVWEVIKHNVTLTYNQNFTGSNAGSMPTNPAAVPVNHGGNYTSTLASNTPTRTGYEFLGWSESASATTATYAAGGSISKNNITADTTIALYAVWKAYPTITYNGNGNTGGTVPTSTSAAPGSTYNIAQGVPVRTGYVFAGWTTVQNNASGTKYSYNGTIAGATGVFTMPTTNVTFYALWNPQITYNANRPTDAASTTVSGMPNPATVTVTYGSNTTAAAAPSLVGWTFTGWTTAANGTGTKYAAGAVINNFTTSMTLYAQWTVKGGYSIAWYDQQTAASDGTAYHTQSNLNWTASISLPSGTPTKTGYTFAGWYTQKNGDSATGTRITAVDTFNKLWQVMKDAGQATETTTQLKVYAQWTEKDKVSLTLNPNGGNYNGTTGVYTVNNILNGGSASIPAAATISNPWREGYNFRGWTESSAGTGTVYTAGHTFTNMTASKTLYAKWEAANVVFTFDKNATASEVTSHKTPDPYQMTVKYGSSIAVPQGTTVYERTAYNFAKWTYTTTAGASADIAAAGANVAVANFKITWTGTSADGTLAGTATIVANWTPYTYTIAWDHNYTGRPTPTTTNNVKPTDTITQPANPTRAGYDFKGWKTVANGTGNTVATGNSVGSTWTLASLPSGATLTAYAQWEEKKVQIRVYGDGSKAGIQYGDGSAYTAGTVIYVGAATGAIYANAGDSTPTAKNVSTGFKPLITDSSYEFNATHGSKWTKGSATGTQVSTAETLALPKTSNLYVTGDYYLTVSPKWFAYTIEYYEQNTTGSGYTKVSSPAGSGTAPFGYALQLGTTAGTNDSTKTVTVTRSDITGFTFNSAAAGSVTNLTAISATVANNVLKLYFDRNQFNVQVSYSGDVPPSMVYTPATDTKRFGETVTLTAPATVTGYTFTGWTLKNTVSGLTAGQVKSGTFSMPNGAVVIEGVWSKVKYNVLFVNDATNGNMSGTSNYQLDYMDSLPATPTINPKDANNYYFMGWELFEGCTSTSSLSVTGGTSKGIMSVDAILGLGAEAGTPWQVTSHSRFVARFGKTVAVSYTNGGANAFGTVNGSMVANTVTKNGTYYTQLQLGWNMPGYGGSIDPSGDRNGLNPHAAPGYKFVGWEWVDVLSGNVTKRAVGSYNAAKKFVLASGDALPTTVDQSYTFTAIWEETSQQIHFVNNCVNIPGVTGAPAPGDIVAKTNEVVSLPKAPAYGAATNPTGYTFMGWTTVSTGYVAGTSPLYTNTFTMTAGVRETGTYNLPAVAADGGYGVTLYPVFSENTVTILYKFATGCDSMGTLSASSEGTTFKMVSGTPNGSTPTANTGYKFVGWFKDAAHTTAVDAAWVNASTKKLTPGKESGVYKAATYYAYFEPEQYVIKFQVGDNGTWTDGTAASTDKSVTLTFNTNYGTNVPTYTGTGAAMKANTGYGFKEWAEINPTTGAVVRTISDSSLRGERVTAARTFKAIWEPRSGYTIVYNTNGGAPAVPSQQVTWNAVIDNVMPAGAKTGQAKQGYDFAGWYTKDDFSDTRIDGSGKTFEQAIAQAGITVDGDGTATLTLYAKWNEKSFTLNYAPSWPGSTTTTFPAKTVTWTQTGLLPSGYATLTETGFDFKNWNTASNATGLVVTNATSFADSYLAKDTAVAGYTYQRQLQRHDRLLQLRPG